MPATKTGTHIATFHQHFSFSFFFSDSQSPPTLWMADRDSWTPATLTNLSKAAAAAANGVESSARQQQQPPITPITFPCLSLGCHVVSPTEAARSEHLRVAHQVPPTLFPISPVHALLTLSSSFRQLSLMGTVPQIAGLPSSLPPIGTVGGLPPPVPTQPMLPSLGALQFLAPQQGLQFGFPFQAPYLASLAAAATHSAAQSVLQSVIQPVVQPVMPPVVPHLPPPVQPLSRPLQSGATPVAQKWTEDYLVARLQEIHGVGSIQATQIDLHNFSLLSATGLCLDSRDLNLIFAQHFFFFFFFSR